MAIKRLHVLFHGNSMHMDGEEDNLKSLVNMFVTARRTGQIDCNSVIFGDNYCIILAQVIGMIIGDAAENPAEKIAKIMAKETEQDAPWRESLKNDEDEEFN